MLVTSVFSLDKIVMISKEYYKMNKMPKIIVVLVVLTILMGSLNACGNQDTIPNSETTLNNPLDITAGNDNSVATGEDRLNIEISDTVYHIKDQKEGWDDPISLALDLIEFIENNDIEGLKSCVNPESKVSGEPPDGSILGKYRGYIDKDRIRIDKQRTLVKTAYFDEYGKEVAENEYWQMRADEVDKIIKNNDDYIKLTTELESLKNIEQNIKKQDEVMRLAREEVSKRFPPGVDIFEDRYFVYVLKSLDELEYTCLTIEIVETKNGYFIKSPWLKEEFFGPEV